MKNLKWLFLILVLFSCKSIKKDKQRSITEDIKVEKTLDTSIKKQKSSLDIQQKDKELIVEETKNTYAVFIIDGEEVLKEITINKKTTERDVQKTSSEIKDEVLESDLIVESNDLVKSDDLDLKKESEGMEVISEIVKGLMDGIIGGTSKKIISVILILILVPIFIKVYRNLKQKNDVDKK